MTRTVKICSRRKMNCPSVNCGSRSVFSLSLLTFLLASIVDGQISQEQGDAPSSWSPPQHYTHAIQRSYSEAAIRPDAVLPDHISSEQLTPEDYDHDNSPLQRLRRSSDGSYEAEDDDETKDETEPVDQHPKAQHFFPSFAPLFSPPPLGHSRPPYYNQESAFSQRPSYPGGFRDLSYPHAVAESESSTNVLGSGNFGVLRGGTFFAGERDELLSDDLYSPYFHGGNNGHGRPSFYPRNPQPSYHQGDDFFANFRDFADISTPTKSSYSQYYVVYARQNATSDEHQQQPKLVDDDVEYDDSSMKTFHHTPHQRPRNIIEQLSLLDAAPQLSHDTETKKLSKRKLKLHIYKKKLMEKQDRATVKSTVSPKDIYDPLLALS